MKAFIRHLAGAALVVLATAGISQAQFSVTGTVTDQFSQPADSVKITLFDGAGNPIGLPLILTDASGGYAIVGLPPGDYLVGFEPPSRHRLLTEEIPVTIVSSNVIADAILQPGFLLSGVVTDPTGAGIFNIDLKVESKTTGDLINTPGDNTDVTGFYDVVVPADELIVTWRAVDPLSLPWIPVEMQFVVVADTTVNVTMVLGFFVSGTVRDHLNAPVANVNMDFIDVETGVKLDTKGDVTNALGMYQVQVPSGSYDVRAKLDPVSRLQSVEILSVPINADTTVSVSVVPGWLLSGTVTDPGLIGIENVDIDLRDSLGEKFYTAFSNTGPSGAFQIVVPADILGVTFKPPVDTSLASIDRPNVAVSMDTTLDVTLPQGITLTGTVTQSAGGAVPNVDIDLRTVPGNVSVPLVGDRTDAAGSFTVVAEPGTYDIQVEPPLATSLVALLDSAVPLLVNTVDAWVVAPGAHIRGRTFDSGIAPIPNVSVSVEDLVAGLPVFTPSGKSDASGHYDVVVPFSNHRLVFRTDPLSALVDSVTYDPFPVLNDLFLSVVFGPGEPTAAPPPSGISRTGLRKIYPNPFNPTATIRFGISAAAKIDLRIIAVNGTTVRRLVREVRGPGEYRVKWDGRSDSGAPVASGVYFVWLRAGDESFTDRIVLLK